MLYCFLQPVDNELTKADSKLMHLFRRSPETPKEEMERLGLLSQNASARVIKLAEDLYERGGGIPSRCVGVIEEAPPLPDLSTTAEGREYLERLNRRADER